MTRRTFAQFTNAIGEYKSSNRYDAIDTSNRLGRFALGEHTLERIGLVNRDNTPTKNDYKEGWTGKYGITSTEQFLASPAAQDRAFHDVLDWQVKTLRSVLHYDGQIIDSHEISISGMLGAACLTNPFRAWSYVKYGNHNYPEVTGQPPVGESLARFNGYETPYQVNPSSDYTFRGSDGADTIRGYNGNDDFLAKGGDDKFDGGDGIDTIVLSHGRTEYGISQGSGPAAWQIKRQLCDGSMEHKEINNVELIQFAGGEIIDLRNLLSTAPSPVPERADERQLESRSDGSGVGASPATLDVDAAVPSSAASACALAVKTWSEILGIQEPFVVDAAPSSVRVIGIFEGPSHGDGLSA